jgi:hypothetical protein
MRGAASRKGRVVTRRVWSRVPPAEQICERLPGAAAGRRLRRPALAPKLRAHFVSCIRRISRWTASAMPVPPPFAATLLYSC